MSMELSEMAQAAIGFADDQFMELSTSGASIYNIQSLLTDPLATSLSGRLHHPATSGSGSGGVDVSNNSSVRRFFLSAGGPRASRHESTLSMSAMSLASLNSLSRSKSSRHLTNLFDVDEALDDSRAWRHYHQGFGPDLSESGGAKTAQVPLAGGEASTAAAAARKATSNSRGLCSRGEANIEREHTGVLDQATVSEKQRATTKVAAAAAETTTGDHDDHPPPPPFVDGHRPGSSRADILSSAIAELRQPSCSSRLMPIMPTPSRVSTAPPPPPVGVHLEEPTSALTATAAEVSSDSALRLNPSGGGEGSGSAAVGAAASAAVTDDDCSDNLLEGSGIPGSAAGSSVDSSSGGSTVRRAGKGRRRRKIADSIMRKIGLKQNGRQEQQQKLEVGSIEKSNSSSNNDRVSVGGAAAGAGEEAEGGGGLGGRSGSATTSCFSADSSLQGDGDGSKVLHRSGATPQGKPPANSPFTSAPEMMRSATSVGIGKLSETVAVAREPLSIHSNAAAEATTSAVKRVGLRGKIGQVWNSRRKIDKSGATVVDQPKGFRQLQEVGAETTGGSASNSASNSMPPAAILQPTGDGCGGFAFLPLPPPSAAGDIDGGVCLPAAAGDCPRWQGATARPAGGAGPVSARRRAEGTGITSGVGGGGGGSGGGSDSGAGSPLPSTPLGRSNLSFDPDQPMSSSVDGSNVSLPPQFGTCAVAMSLGISNASFDPNRSSKSWFDTSTESQGRVPPEVPMEPWSQSPQLQQQQQLQQQEILANFGVGRMEPVANLSWSESEREAAVAAAAGIALAAATLGADTAATSGNSAAAAAAVSPAQGQTGSAVPALVRPPFDEDLLAAELSDLSVSGDGRMKTHGVPAAASMSNFMPTSTEGEVDGRGASGTLGVSSLGAVREEAVAQPSPQGVLPWCPLQQQQAPTSTVGSEIAGSPDSTGGAVDPMLGPPPSTVPGNLFSESQRAQSVDVGMLNHMTHPRHGSTGPPPIVSRGTSTDGAGGDGRSPPRTAVDGKELWWNGLVPPPTNQLQHSASKGRGVVSDGSHGSSSGGRAAGGATTCPFSSFCSAFKVEAEPGGFLQPPLDGDDGMVAPVLAVRDGEQQQQQEQKRKSWSALQAMIPLSGVARAAAQAATLEHTRRCSLPLATNVGGASDARRPSLPMLASMTTSGASGADASRSSKVVASEAAVPSGGGGGGGGGGRESDDGEGGGARRSLPLPGTSWRAGLPTFGQSDKPSSSLEIPGLDNLKDMLPKRRLNAGRELGVSMGNHKKQCLDSVVGVPTTPKADPAIATTPIGDSSGTSGTGGGAVPPVAAKPAAFEPFDFLTARFGLGVPYSSSSSTVAMTPVPSVLAMVKGDSSSSQPTAEPQQQQKKPGVNAQAKRARQVVAARRPRERGRFMKSRQKWVTQGELKQTKTAPTDDTKKV